MIHVQRTCLMYHAACKVEFQPFKRSSSQLTFFNFLLKNILRSIFVTAGQVSGKSANVSIIIIILSGRRAVRDGRSVKLLLLLLLVRAVYFVKSFKYVSCEYDRLNGWNSTLQAVWYIRHVRWTCLFYTGTSFIIWFLWSKPTILLLMLSFTKNRSRVFYGIFYPCEGGRWLPWMLPGSTGRSTIKLDK